MTVGQGYGSLGEGNNSGAGAGRGRGVKRGSWNRRCLCMFVDGNDPGAEIGSGGRTGAEAQPTVRRAEVGPGS